MRKKQSGRTVQFCNLSEDHKAEFIQFLIKNNICFQEGKQNCTASIAMKENVVPKAKKQNKQNKAIQKPSRLSKTQKGQTKLMQTAQKNNIVRPEKVLKQLTPRNHHIINRENLTDQKLQLKTPTKSVKLNSSSLSCQKAISIQKSKKATPHSVKPVKTNQTEIKQEVSDYCSKQINSAEQKVRREASKQVLDRSREKQGIRRSETGRQRIENKYAGLFQGGQRGRPVRWPLSVLQRYIEQIYDDIFTRNTQCLQTRNIGHALRTLNLTSFAQLVQSYFHKRFKGSKLATTNLNNLLYSLSYHLNRQINLFFLTTFEDFLLGKLQHEDTLYYLFARNVLKRELRAVQKMRQTSRIEGTYFPEGLRSKDIPKCLRAIIGRDSELLNQYRDLVLARISSQPINTYHFLRVLLDDYHQKRTSHEQEGESGQALFDKEGSYEQCNDELTFGEDHQDPSELYFRPEQDDFWNCYDREVLRDSLFQLVRQKLQRKAMQFVQILAADMGKGHLQLQRLGSLLSNKAQSMAHAVFEMNKMKWFRQLGISNPSEEDIQAVEGVQMRLRELKESPSGRDIGEFCKSVLTVQQLVNHLEIALISTE